MIFLTRRETFCASHRLFIEGLSDEENFNIFGKCSNPNWHGHNYELFVTVKGKPDSQTGLVINLKTLSEIIKKEIIEICDHKNLNTEVPFLKGINPTTENLAITFWKVLEEKLKKYNNLELHCIKIRETENNIVEYYGNTF